MAKNPQRPPQKLTLAEHDVVEVRRPLWRVHTIVGPHALRWNELRHYGPARTMRWDPHPPPPAEHPDYAVSYAALDPVTVFAEVFQLPRAIIVAPDRALAGWVPTRALRLLDLTGDWALRNGASASLFAAPKSTTRAWALAICDRWPDLDGLLVPSTMTMKPMVVLFAQAANSFPVRPNFTRTLHDPSARHIIDWSAATLGWPVSGPET